MLRSIQRAVSLDGRSLEAGAPARALAFLAACALAALDLTHFTEFERAYSPARLLPAGALFVCLLPVWRRDRGPLLAPLPSGFFWLRAVLALFALSLLFAWPFFAYLRWTKGGLPPSVLRDMDLSHYAWLALVLAPVVEELVYRGAVCLGLWIALGPWPAVVLSGTAFTYLHVLYGNFAPNHLVAGLILSWAFVKSRQLWMAMALHAAGNLLAITADLLFLE